MGVGLQTQYTTRGDAIIRRAQMLKNTTRMLEKQAFLQISDKKNKY